MNQTIAIKREDVPDGLVLVYNADAGLFNTLADIGHKVVSPATYPCVLCELTHGYFAMRRTWAIFAESLAMPVTYLHRDQFRSLFPDDAESLPAVFRVAGGDWRRLLDRDALRGYRSVAELADAIRALL